MLFAESGFPASVCPRRAHGLRRLDYVGGREFPPQGYTEFLGGPGKVLGRVWIGGFTVSLLLLVRRRFGGCGE